MIYLAILGLGCLSFFNYAVSRSALFPPFLFSATWFVSLVGLLLSGDAFYPLAPNALLVFLTGAFFFSIGGWCGSVLFANKNAGYPPTKEQVARARKVLDIGLLISVIGLPFYVREIIQTANLFDFTVLATLRFESVETSALSERSFSLTKNLIVVSNFIAMAMHYENDGTPGRRWRSFLAILVAICYSVLTGSKGWILIFPTLAFMTFVGRKKVKVLTLLAVLGLTVVFFSAGLLMINFVYSETGDFGHTAELLARNIRIYWLGNLVAFNRVVEAPDSIAAVQSLKRFFLETANGLGATFDIPSIHADYTDVSSLDNTNTYTIYFSYFKDFGWPGVVGGMTLLGAGLSVLYKYATRNKAVAVFAFGTAAVGIILSLHAEHFVLALNHYIKLGVMTYLVYDVLSRRLVWK